MRNETKARSMLLIAAVALSGLLLPATGSASPAAATICPPFSFINNVNLAKNPDFEIGPSIPGEAAARWMKHSDNYGAPVSAALVGPPGARMLLFTAGGSEGGVFQLLQSPPKYLMFSAWVYVNAGHVVLQANGGATGPAAWSTKHHEWEQLRVCTDGSVPTDALVIYNQDPSGGQFYVDRVEVFETPQSP